MSNIDIGLIGLAALLLMLAIRMPVGLSMMIVSPIAQRWASRSESQIDALWRGHGVNGVEDCFRAAQMLFPRITR